MSGTVEYVEKKNKKKKHVYMCVFVFMCVDVYPTAGDMALRYISVLKGQVSLWMEYFALPLVVIIVPFNENASTTVE